MFDEDRARLTRVLETARAKGFLGPGPVEPHLDHALGFVDCIAPEAAIVVDLGSGGGLPGLVLALARPLVQVRFIDASQRRCAHLGLAVGTLGIQQRCTVHWGRAETLARDPGLRAASDAVTARSFGGPAVTAECAVAFLRVGGALVVSEPPTISADEGATRWPSEELEALGFAPPSFEASHGAGFAVLRKVAPTAERWPRRDGMPTKRPIWR